MPHNLFHNSSIGLGWICLQSTTSGQLSVLQTQTSLAQNWGFEPVVPILWNVLDPTKHKQVPMLIPRLSFLNIWKPFIIMKYLLYVHYSDFVHEAPYKYSFF